MRILRLAALMIGALCAVTACTSSTPPPPADDQPSASLHHTDGDEPLSGAGAMDAAASLCEQREDICAGVYLSRVAPEYVVLVKAGHPDSPSFED